MRDSVLDRRGVLSGLAALGGAGLTGCATGAGAPAAGGSQAIAPVGPADPARFLAPLRARPDRIFDITVCLRPFRAAGPRLDVEEVGDALVVHNYGHGGSGWSLSWGSSDIAVRKALTKSTDRIAVIGCGALGLTSALLAQSAGKQVTIYARELIHETFSMNATGSWSPDSRISLADAVAPDFPSLWEAMARKSLKAFRGYLGLPGDPVRWMDHYTVIDGNNTPIAPNAAQAAALTFGHYSDRLSDMSSADETLRPEDTPFRAQTVRRNTNLVFNITNYAQTLMAQFRAAGGRVERREFRDPREFGRLPEKAVIHCTGYGARTLWRDETVVPVRGQIAWLIPQPELNYALRYRRITVLPRSDGIVIQAGSSRDMGGYGDDNLAPDREVSLAAIEKLAMLYENFGAPKRERRRII